ncbi:MAG: CRISPR-associated endoribonuclease Cas6 [Nitrosomonas sp.]|nr:MAG: CRISPR-associated endoribonuclease Cas6 [Nitrosomonas sp.]
MFSIEMCRIQFSLIATDTINLPSYKGSTFRGGFGRALKAISPTWSTYFFQPLNQYDSQDIPKPFVLLPPLDQQQIYQANETFHCEITLFADATRHVAIVQAAIEYLGNKLGLGRSQGKFKIADITESSFSGTNRHSRTNLQTLSLELKTRLRLKSANHLWKQSLPPPFSLLMERLLDRLKALQKNYSDIAIDEQKCSQLLHQAHEIQTLPSNVEWKDWNRYSSSQEVWMKFGGLLGKIYFQGNLQPFLPYLQIGEWCHIGGKSSFGLGKYLIDYGEPHENTPT